MNSNFYELFGQVGATVVSILATLFVGYMLYLKERRDRIGDDIIALKRNMCSIVRQLSVTPIPGVLQSLLSHRPIEGEKWDQSSITEWAAGISWDMRVQAHKINEREIWDEVRKALENLVK